MRSHISPPLSPPDDPKLVVKAGRCGRLFTAPVCSKVLQIIHQWSMAGASVKDCPPHMLDSIIERWLLNKSESGTDLESLLPDINTLVSSATQNSFLYHLAIVLWRLWPFTQSTQRQATPRQTQGATAPPRGWAAAS